MFWLFWCGFGFALRLRISYLLVGIAKSWLLALLFGLGLELAFAINFVDVIRVL